MSKDIEFIVDDILESKLKDDSFDYIFDRGCFHVLEPSSRQRYVNQVSRILRDGGLLFLKTFSTKEPSRGGGPYRFSIDEIDLIELNEAFAAQYLAVEKELGLDRSKTNVNGGAIALGHPLGATGTRLIITVLNELHRRAGRYGLATACIGGGQGIAMIVERV